MNTLNKIKEYIQRELEQFIDSKDELTKSKDQLTKLISEIDNLFVNSEIDLFDKTFQSYNFSISFDKLKDAIALVNIFNQSNITDIPQYKDILDDLANLKKEINNIISDMDAKITIIENNQEKVDTLKDVLNILNNNENSCVLSKEEIFQLFEVIKMLSLDSKEKYALIFDITNHNVDNKVVRRVENEIKTSSNEVSMHIEENIQVINEILAATDEIEEPQIETEPEEITFEQEIIDNCLLEKVQGIIKHLSKFYEVRSFEEIDAETKISARMRIYSSSNGISKYNWPLIYYDLCNNLVPKYKKGESVEEIGNIFKFIVGIYDNYESICPEFDESELINIKNFIKIVENINREDIERLHKNIKDMIDSGCEVNDIDLKTILGLETDIPYSNCMILLYAKIFELQDAYEIYLQERVNEIKNRFSSSVAIILERVKAFKELIGDNLEEIKSMQSSASIINKGDKPQIINDSDEESVHDLKETEIPSLVIFADEVADRDNILTLFEEVASHNESISVVNCIYYSHYMCRNYNVTLVGDNNSYRVLKNKSPYNSLEPNHMYRSRRRGIRCTYRTITVSQNNKKIIQRKYPAFSDTLFLITGIYHEAGNKEYIGKTNRFVNVYKEKINHYIDLFSNDFETREQENEALSLIGDALKAYNYMCSSAIDKKTSEKGGK